MRTLQRRKSESLSTRVCMPCTEVKSSQEMFAEEVSEAQEEEFSDGNLRMEFVCSRK